MALLSDRSGFDRLICQRIYFADAIGKLTARMADDDVRREAILRYAQWRAFDDESTLDSCFGDIPSAEWQEIIDAVNSMWDDCRP